MTDEPESTDVAADDSVQPTIADVVTNPAMVPMDDDAGGPTADNDDMEPSDAEAAALLGELS